MVAGELEGVEQEAGGQCGAPGGGVGRLALHLVLLHVPVQVGLLAEAPVALRALERLLLVVDVAHVPLQVGADGEGAVAVRALRGRGWARSGGLTL